jgi:quinol monooxygenase YgiN
MIAAPGGQVSFIEVCDAAPGYIVREESSMSVVITMEVGPVDWEKFKAAIDWANSRSPKGHIGTRVYRAEDDPSRVLIVDEWESHDDFHAYAEATGEEFNRRAGTEDLEWRDQSWTPA